MGILRAKAGHHDPPIVGFAVAIRVLQVEQLSALADIDAAVTRLDSGGDEQVVGEHGRLVRLPIVVGVIKNDHLVRRHLAGKDLRINLRTGHPQPALGIEVHLDRLGQERVLRE